MLSALVFRSRFAGARLNLGVVDMGALLNGIRNPSTGGRCLKTSIPGKNPVSALVLLMIFVLGSSLGCGLIGDRKSSIG